MSSNNSTNSVTKYIAPALKITAGLVELAISAYSFNSWLKSANISTKEFKASYLAPYPTRTTQALAASTYFLISGIKDAMQIYKQPKN